MKSGSVDGKLKGELHPDQAGKEWGREEQVLSTFLGFSTAC
jgi:hypothetical protein